MLYLTKEHISTYPTSDRLAESFRLFFGPMGHHDAVADALACTNASIFRMSPPSTEPPTPPLMDTVAPKGKQSCAHSVLVYKMPSTGPTNTLPEILNTKSSVAT